MDEINAFFDVNQEFKREVLPSGYVNARPVVKVEEDRFVRRKFVGKDYGEEYRRAELENMKKVAEIESVPVQTMRRLAVSTIDDIESEFGDDEGDVHDDVYKKYDFNRTLPDLPIVAIKDRILATIENNPVVVLEGATGCGKTTQVPQFILDDAYVKRKRVNIVMTQPRRIAAISIANRVAKERCLPPLPHLIGFQIGLKVVTNDDTRITFCTTGVLLEKLVVRKTLADYTHIILDEVHERSQNMDFLFIVIKQLRPQVAKCNQSWK